MDNTNMPLTYRMGELASAQDVRLGDIHAQCGSVRIGVNTKTENGFFVHAEVEYHNIGVKVSVYGDESSRIAAHCSRCGSSTAPGLCRHAIATLIAMERGLARRGNPYPQYHFAFDIDRRKRALVCRFSFAYEGLEEHMPNGVSLFNIVSPEVPDAMAISQTLSAYYRLEQTGDHFELPLSSYGAQIACRAIDNDFDQLRRFGEVVIEGNLSTLAFHGSAQFQLDLNVSDGTFHVKLDAEHIAPGEVAAYSANAHCVPVWWDTVYYSAKHNAMVTCDKNIESIEGFLDHVSLKPGKALRGASLPIALAFRAKAALDTIYPDLDVDTAKLDHFVESAIANEEFTVPGNLTSVLKDWQVGGFNRLQQSYHLGLGGLLLADSMGLGKTIQTIAHISAIKRDAKREDGPIALVVCPASLVFNWIHEFNSFAPQLSVLRVQGPAKQRRESILDAAEAGFDVVVSSYDHLMRDHGAYLIADWDLEVLVIDEAQYIKNRSAKRSRAVKNLPAKHHVALTGTPIENSLDDAFSIFEFVTGETSRYLGNRRQFLGLRRDVAAGQARSTDFFQNLVKPYTLRRTTELLGLPPLTQRVLHVEMDPESRQVYQLINDELVDILRAMSDEQYKDAELMILTKLLRLRQCAFDSGLTGVERTTGPSAKVTAIVSLVKEALERNEKTIVFADLVRGFDAVSDALKAEGISHGLLRGDMPLALRDGVVARFNDEEDRTACLLAGLKAGGVGLNIVGPQGEESMQLRTVIHATPWWNPAARMQATARTYRLGQNHEIHEINLLCADTIEEHVWGIQKEKETLADDVFGSSSELERIHLTRQELLTLLSREELNQDRA